MEFGTREILIILGIVIILGILLDGLRRVRQARHGSLRVSRRRQAIFDDDIDDIGGEFPSGQVRVKHRDERSAEEVSDNIRRYHESTASRCTSAYRDITGESRNPVESGEPAAPGESPATEQDIPAQFGDEVVSREDSATPDAFAADDSDDDNAAVDTVPEAPLVASRDEPDLELDKPFRVEPDSSGERGENRSREPQVREARRKPFWQDEPRPSPPPADAGKAEGEGAEESPGSPAFEVVVVHVMAKKENQFEGGPLLEALLSHGLRFGEMGIFHRHEKANGAGPVKFSLANSVKPGTFDIDHMDAFSTPGVTLFMPLEKLDNPLDYFDEFVKTAQSLAKTLGGEVKDETRSVFTRQTVEHYRQQIIEYTRKSFTLSHN